MESAIRPVTRIGAPDPVGGAVVPGGPSEERARGAIVLRTLREELTCAVSVTAVEREGEPLLERRCGQPAARRVGAASGARLQLVEHAARCAPGP